MKKNKIFLPMIGLLAFAMGLVGCNKPAEDSGKNTQSSQVTPQKETIKVTDPDNKNAGELVIEQTLQLKASVEGVTWKSADEKIATVDTAGKVTAVAAGEVKIKASKEGYYDGSYSLTVKRPAALAKVAFEKADHYAADGWWGTADDGWSPIYARSEGNASDAQCIAHMDNGDKETLTFTSNAAIKAELVIMMASQNGVEDMSAVMGVKFNKADIAMTGKALESTGDNNTFAEFSLGEQNIVSGDNVLELSFLASAPYIDDLAIYSKQQATIAVKEAAAKEQIVAANAELSINIGETAQINLTKPTDKTGVSYVSGNEEFIEVNSTGLVTGKALGSTYVTVKKDGMYSTRVAVTVTDKPVPGEIRVEAEAQEEGFDWESLGFHMYPDGSYIRYGHSGGAYITGYDVSEEISLTYKFNSEKAQTMTLVISGAPHYQMTEDYIFGTDATIKLNDAAVTCPATAKIERGEGSTMGAKTQNVTIGDVQVKQGENTFVLEFHGKAPALDCYKFLPKN